MDFLQLQPLLCLAEDGVNWVSSSCKTIFILNRYYILSVFEFHIMGLLLPQKCLQAVRCCVLQSSEQMQEDSLIQSVAVTQELYPRIPVCYSNLGKHKIQHSTNQLQSNHST